MKENNKTQCWQECREMGTLSSTFAENINGNILFGEQCNRFSLKSLLRCLHSITSLWETYLQEETCAKIYYKDTHAKTEYEDACDSTVYNEGKSNLTIKWKETK